MYFTSSQNVQHMMSDSKRLFPEPSLVTWEPTKETLHRYLQILGKIRLALMPSPDGLSIEPLRPRESILPDKEKLTNE